MQPIPLQHYYDLVNDQGCVLIVETSFTNYVFIPIAGAVAKKVIISCVISCAFYIYIEDLN